MFTQQKNFLVLQSKQLGKLISKQLFMVALHEMSLSGSKNTTYEQKMTSTFTNKE